MTAPAFPWLASGSRRGATHPARVNDPAQAERRAAMYRAELLDRAGLYFRLGYTTKRAVARLKANVAWDFEAGDAGAAGLTRPAGLTDREIGEIVKTAYQRRPAR